MCILEFGQPSENSGTNDLKHATWVYLQIRFTGEHCTVIGMSGGLASVKTVRVRHLGSQTREDKSTSNWETCSLAGGRHW